jgi:hypothetical protein
MGPSTAFALPAFFSSSPHTPSLYAIPPHSSPFPFVSSFAQVEGMLQVMRTGGAGGFVSAVAYCLRPSYSSPPCSHDTLLLHAIPPHSSLLPALSSFSQVEGMLRSMRNAGTGGNGAVDRVAGAARLLCLEGGQWLWPPVEVSRHPPPFAQLTFARSGLARCSSSPK